MAFIIDSHEDLAYNMATYGRDYLRSVHETRQTEANTEVPARTGDSLLGWPEYQNGQVALVFATLFVSPYKHKGGEWETVYFRSPEESRQHYVDQVNRYRRWNDEHSDKFRQVLNKRDLSEVLKPWEETPADYPKITHPVGLVTLMEGAEGLSAPEELEEWYEQGVRIVGPVWAGTRYCGGTIEPGPFRSEGYALLGVMSSLGLTLDITHMSMESALTALDVYQGPVVATHANPAALVNGNTRRNLSDDVLRRLIERDGIIGVIPFNGFLSPGWVKGDPRAPLERLVAHIDYICQMSGSSRHVGIGTDFDGGFGVQHVPQEIDTVADLQKLGPLLAERGYSGTDIAAILGKNWQRKLENTLPE